jgi:hypothetical protein
MCSIISDIMFAALSPAASRLLQLAQSAAQ